MINVEIKTIGREGAEMAECKYADVVVDGKRIKDWVKSDEDLVDYAKCEFLSNVSNTDGTVIYDLGEYEYDSKVEETRYCNGVDLARVAACVKYGEQYDGMRFVTAINGDDYVRIFYNSFRDATIQDFIIYFFRLLDGDIYISETNYRVYVKGRVGTEEEWKAAVEELYSRSYRQ